MSGEGEEICAVRVERHGVADRGDQGPAGRGAGEVIGGGAGEERGVSYSKAAG